MAVRDEVPDIMSVSEQEETKFTQCERRMTVRDEVPDIMSVSEQEETNQVSLKLRREGGL